MPCPHCGVADPGPGPFCMSCGRSLAPALQGPPTLGQPGPAVPALVALGIDPMTGNRDVLFNIWGPFAGYGTRGRHVGWLMDRQGAQAEVLRDAVTRRFEHRKIPDATVECVTLKRQGVIVDSRPYYLVRRGLTTAGLHIARFGEDLYVSQVTYFKGPISPLRVIVVVAMVLFAFIYPTMYQGALEDLGSLSFLSGGRDLSGLASVVCCVGPLYLLDYLALIVLAVYSGYRWLTDKDLLAALRVPPNEFDNDDTVALEKSVEETVRESLDEVGIDQRLMPQAQEYGIRRRLI